MRDQRQKIKKQEKATVIKAVWGRHRNRQVDQWSRMNTQETDPPLWGNLIYDRAGTAIIGKRMDYLAVGYPYGK